MLWMGRVLAVLCLLVCASPTGADGKVFSSVAVGAHPIIPDQRALICFEDGVQTLVIDTKFVGPGTDFAWLVPVPSHPEFSSATEGLFPTLESLFAQRVRTHVAGPPKSLIIVLVMVFAAAPMVRTARGCFYPTLVLIVLVALSIWLPSLGTARSSAAGAGSIDVLERRSVGLYDTAVLCAESAEALLEWLSENGFQVPAHVEPVIADYLSRDWLFVAAKLSDNADAEIPKAPHPLRLRFATEEPVYPMALTTVDNTSLTVDLFVFANGTAASPGWNVQLSLPTERVDEGNSWGWQTPIRRTTSPVPISHPGLKELVGATSWATHLRGSFQAGQAVPDADIQIGHPVTRVPLRLSEQAVASVAVDIGLALAIVSLIVLLVLKNYHDWDRQRAGRGVLLVLASATLLSSMLVLAVPSEKISSSAYDRGSDLREAIHACDLVGALLKEELVRQPSQAISALDVRGLAEQRVQSVSLELGLTAIPVHRDSAGNYTVNEHPDGTIVFRAYDSIGGICSQTQLWPAVVSAPQDRPDERAESPPP